MLGKPAAALVLLGVLSSGPPVFPQKVTTKVTVYNEIFLTENGFLPLPANAVELESDHTIRSGLFRSPLRLAVDREGNVFVSSTSNGALCRFDAAGRNERQLSLNKDGTSALKGPAGIAVVEDQLAVHETLRGRLDLMGLEGSRVRYTKIPAAEEFAIARDGRIYFAPPIESKDEPLFSVLLADGRRSAFGRPLSFAHSMTTLNARSLAVDDAGNVYVAFRYFPVVRKFSSDGALLAEFRLDSAVMEAKEKYNLKAVGEGITDPTRRVAYKPLIIDIEACGDKVYLLSHIPRLEILELDADGRVTATFWMDARELYLANDLSVLVTGREKIFYVARSSPPSYEVDALKARAEVSSSLEADIRKWTTEIATYPDNALAYINRGAARHQAGDHGGAIADFSKAIELDPGSALAFNNRGLSRVKAKDYEGAIGDFSKAIELGPGVAAIFFNRGIARIHADDLPGAIEDFTKAAAIDGAFVLRAQEQIDYCRARLRK